MHIRKSLKAYNEIEDMTALLSYIKILRPHQWLKNLFCFFLPFCGKMVDPSVRSAVIPALLSFSLAASCGYIINDIKDRMADRNHVIKKQRVIAKGELTVVFAAVIAAVLYVAALLISSNYVSRRFEWFLLMYLFVSLTYTFFLKDIVLVDIFFISFGFLLRVLAGGEAFRTTVTSWLFLTVFMISLLLAAGKRLGELVSLGDAAHSHRRSLTHYSQSFLEGILWFSASASLVTYALYTLEQANGIFHTVPIAAFGLLRYIYIVKQGQGDPTEALLKDGQITAVGIVWVFVIGAIIYIG